MITVELAVFFLIGLLGGAHCIGMCGPLVTVYASRLSKRTEVPDDRLTVYEVRQHALFNAGRTVSYATIGGLAGLAGGMVFLASDAVFAYADIIRGVVGIGIGLIVIAIGVRYLADGGSSLEGALPGLGWSRVTSILTAKIDRWVGGSGIVVLGAVHGLLPCPILYPAFLYAFSTGSPCFGVVALAALGIGTFPAVFLFGTVIESISVDRRVQLHRVLGVMFLALGYIPLSHGLMEFGIHLPHPDLPFYQPLR